MLRRNRDQVSISVDNSELCLINQARELAGELDRKPAHEIQVFNTSQMLEKNAFS